MKKLLISLVAVTTLTAFGQTFTGGSGELSPTFKFGITGLDLNYENYKTKYFFVDNNNNTSDLNCVAYESIDYKNSLNRSLSFDFENEEKCSVVEACLVAMQAGEKILVEVDRDTKKIVSVELPLSCSLDAWASVEDENIDGELI